MTHDDHDALEMKRLVTQLVVAAEHLHDVFEVCSRGSRLGASAEDLDDWTTTARAELSRTIRAWRLFCDQTLKRQREEPDQSHPDWPMHAP